MKFLFLIPEAKITDIIAIGYSVSGVEFNFNVYDEQYSLVLNIDNINYDTPYHGQNAIYKYEHNHLKTLICYDWTHKGLQERFKEHLRIKRYA